MVKKKIYKLNKKVIILLFVLIIVLVILFIPKNYSKKYKINNYEIIESFKNNRYNLTIVKDGISYDYNFDNNYIGNKIVKEIKEENTNNNSCIIPIIKDLTPIPLCSGIDYRLVDDIDFNEYKKTNDEKVKNIDNIELYNTLDRSYLVWNYNNFTYINNDDSSTINLFDNDYYNIDDATIINDYLVIANYDNNYNFKELILINLKNKNKDIWKLNYEISFDSYILGTENNYIYVVDKKNKTEYRLDINRKEMKIVGTENNGGIIYNNNTYEDVSMYKLVNNNLSFDYGYDQNFIVDNNKLYLKTSNNKVLLSNNDITKIVYQNNNYVYYLVGDTLYYYDLLNGEVKIMKNFEWNFNNNNVIFIY